MRQYLNLVTESDNAVDQAMNQIGDYIRHNAHTDLISAANVLKSAGYTEPFGAGTYYRVIFHDITEQDRESFMTVGEVADHIRANPRYELGRGAGGFTTSYEKAEEFARGQLWHTDRENLPHHEDVLLSSLSERHWSLVMIYEVAAPANAIVLSMRGLKALLGATPPGHGHDNLNVAINDLYDGYGFDDEVVIDTGKVRVIGVHLYSFDPEA